MTEPKRTYDVAAYVWPAYSDAPEMRWAFPERMGEWERVRQARPKFEGHRAVHEPLWGYVNEADPYVMRMQIDAAADHAVNVFIYDWYWYDQRPFLEGCLNNGYLQAPNHDRVRFYLMWANHDVTYGWDLRNSSDRDTVLYKGWVNRADFEGVCRHVIERYLLHPSYYTIAGKPVFCVYDLANLLKGLDGLRNTRKALDWFRSEVERAGAPGLHLQCTLRGGNQNYSGFDRETVVNQFEALEQLGFDSVTHYQWCHFLPVRDRFDNLVTMALNAYREIEDKTSITYYPHLSVGWDSNARFKELHPAIITENTPGRIEAGLRQLKAFMDERPALHPLVTLNAWNEWTETSYLQPDREYGYGYLQAVRNVFGA
jgi:hypothetical protein